MIQIDIWQILGRIPFGNWLLLAVCAAAFIGFYVLDYRKWGCLSFASYFFGFNYLLKIIVMYPFAWSANNILATSRHFESIVVHIDKALYITIGGFVCMVLGILAARVLNRRQPAGCELIYHTLARGWQSGGGVALGVMIVAGLTGVLFLMGFQAFVARSLVFERNDLRPFYNLWSQVVPFFAINAIVFGAVNRKWGAVAIGLAMAALGIIGGNRTVAILTMMQVGVILAMPKRFRNLPVMLLAALGLASLAVTIGSLRDASMTDQRDFLFSLLYGNDLSDLRDFAWILTGMDDSPLYWGKTYIAGYLSFIPAFMFPFREEFGFGRVSPQLAGLDPLFHSGLRPPIFGEMYVNFGLPGVLIGGFIYGVLVGRVMHWITRTLNLPNTPDKPVSPVVVWTGFVMLQIIDSVVFTPAFFGVYVLVALLFLGQMLARIGARRWA
ncbi:MAG: oligosaccharide repeat unit polymerase [Azospirillaceae bacterium]|nr:oligosaccharide repeat unit polymerase [Azospirillaceae bacterium]